MRQFVGSVLTLVACCSQLAAEEPATAENLLAANQSQLVWRVDQSEGAKGMVQVDQGAVQFVVTQVGKTPAQVRAFLGDLDLLDGKVYTVSGRIKALRPRRIWLTATIDEDDWHGIGLHEKLNVTSEYQPFEFTFRVSDTVRRKNRLQFIIDHEVGSVWVQDIRLHCK